MGATHRSNVRFNATLMAEDMAAKGWLRKDLAKRARPRLTAMTVGRFLDGSSQTAPTAKRLARALGHDVERYLIRSTEAA